MKRIILLSIVLAFSSLTISSQIVDVAKVRAEVERARPKHNQPSSTGTAASVAAQQAAVNVQATSGVNNNMQQAQHINQTYTAENLAKQKSIKPKVPAGAHTATSYSQKNGKGVKFGTGSGKANEAINIKYSNNKETNVNLSKSGNISKNGGSDNSTYKNVTKFKANQKDIVQKRQQRTPITTTQNTTTIITNQNPIVTSSVTGKTVQQSNENNSQQSNGNNDKNADNNKQPQNNGNKMPNSKETLRSSKNPCIPIELNVQKNHDIESIQQKIKEGDSTGKIAGLMAIREQANKQIQNGLKDGWKSTETAWKEQYKLEKTGKKCKVIKNGNCVTK